MIRYKRLNESFDPVKTVSMQFRRTLEDSQYGKALRKIDILDETVAIVEEFLDAMYKECEKAGVKVVPGAKWRLTGSYRDYDPNDYKFHCECYLDLRAVFEKEAETTFSTIRKSLESLGEARGEFSGTDCEWRTHLSTSDSRARLPIWHQKYSSVAFRFSEMSFCLRIKGLKRPDMP